MSRALILPTPGDPCMMWLWFDMFKRWENEVDRLYLVVNTPSQEADELIQKIIEPFKDKICYIFVNHQIEHGEAIRRALEEVQETYVGLIEDDTYVFRSGAIDDQFAKLESGEWDVVGSKRGSCSAEILEAAKAKWDLSYEGYGDQGCNFWPSLFFCKTELLRQTNQEFGAKSWIKGEPIKELDGYVVKDEVCASDTFVWASLQVRNLVDQSKINYIPQNHAGPWDMQDFRSGRGLFDGNSKWVHVGSLSSGFHGVLKNDKLISLAYINTDNAQPAPFNGHPTNDSEKKEWERRVIWWTIARDFSEDTNFSILYTNAINRIIKEYKLDLGRMHTMQPLYLSLLTK